MTLSESSRAGAVSAYLLVLLFAVATPATRPPPAVASPDQAWASLLKGASFSGAEEVLRFFDAHRSNPRAAFVAARALHDLGAADKGTACFQAIEKEDSRSPVAPLGLGKIALLNEEYGRADLLFRIAAARAVRIGDRTGESVAREGLGWALRGAKRWEEAAGEFGEQIRLAEESGSGMGAAFGRYALGVTLKEISRGGGVDRVEEAVRHLERSIEESEAIGVPLWAAKARITLSILARWRGDMGGALRLRKEALVRFEEAGDEAAQVECLQRIAAMQLYLGELDDAQRLLHRGWRLAEEIGKPRLLGWIALTLGSICYLTGENERAVAYYDRAIGAAKEEDEGNLLAASLMNKGLVLVEEGRYGEALQQYDEALRLCRSRGDRRGEARILNNKGTCLLLSGETEEAVRLLENTLALTGEIGTPGKTEAYVRRDLGLCLSSLGEWERAEVELDRAGEMARRMDLPGIPADVARGKAVIAIGRGEKKEALRLLREAIEIREGIRGRLAGAARVQSRRFGRSSALYEETVHLLYRMHRDDPGAGHDRTAFDIAQRAKARSFLDRMAESDFELPARADSAFRRRERELEERIAAVMDDGEGTAANEIEIARLEEELEVLEGKIRAADPRYAELIYPKPATLSEVRREILNEDELLLEYLLGDEASYLWAVSRDTFRFLRLPPRDSVESAVRLLLAYADDYNLAGPDPAFFLAAATPASAALLFPAGEEVSRAKRIIIVPHGILHYLPFEILLTSTEQDHGGYGGLAWLVKGADPVYLPSVSVLALLRAGSRGRREQRPGSLLLIGNPSLPKEGEAGPLARTVLADHPVPLPYVEEEMARLRSLYDDGRVLILDGEKATRREIARAGEDGPYETIHFATHGLFNERRPRYSGLVITADAESGEDGFLTIGELFGMKLDCDLAVLSSCSSALGEEITGEGVIGIHRALLYAGAECVVASLWEVSGRATSLFMAEFHAIIESSGGDRARALAETKRRMISGALDSSWEEVELSHPFFWSPFVLTGNPGIGD